MERVLCLKPPGALVVEARFKPGTASFVGQSLSHYATPALSHQQNSLKLHPSLVLKFTQRWCLNSGTDNTPIVCSFCGNLNGSPQSTLLVPLQ